MKKDKIKSFIQSLRYHSIFLKTMCVLTVILLLAGIGFQLGLRRVYRQRQEEAVRESYTYIISEKNQILESGLLSLRVRAGDLMNQDNARSLALLGNQKDETKLLDVMLSLNTFVADNSWTDYSCLYLIDDGLVLTSANHVLSYEEYQQPELFEVETDDENLVWYHDKLYMRLGFPEERPLVQMLIRMDMSDIYQDLYHDSFSDKTVYMYYEGNPAFPTSMAYPSDSQLMIQQGEVLSDSIYRGEAVSFSGYVLASQENGSKIQWTALIPSQEISEMVITMVPTLIPMAVLIVILLAAGSIFLIYLVYRPIQETLTSFESSIDDMKDSGASATELELMQNVHRYMQGRQARMQNMLTELGTAVEERLLRSLIMGEEIDDLQVREILSEATMDFRMEGLFQVIVLTLYYGPDRVCSLREQELHYWTVEQAIREFWSATSVASKLYFFEGQNKERILLLSHPQDTSIRTLKRWMVNFEQILREQEEDLNIYLEFGSGYNYHNLMDTYEARVDSEKNLQERIYYRRGQADREAIWQRYSKKAEEMLQAELTETGQYLRNIRLLVQEAMSDAEKAPIICSRICNVILERMIQLNIPVEEGWLTYRRNLEEHQEPMTTEDARYEALEHFLEVTLKALESAVGDEKYRYIENAKRYIEAHYNDSMLSLNTVSDYCGISSSYLSRLFTTYMPPGFVEYLNQYRIRQAEILLTSTSYTIVEIGFKTGFNSPQNFGRVFKKYHGETPGQFRTRGKESAACEDI